jgi:rubredoxin
MNNLRSFPTDADPLPDECPACGYGAPRKPNWIGDGKMAWNCRQCGHHFITATKEPGT